MAQLCRTYPVLRFHIYAEPGSPFLIESALYILDSLRVYNTARDVSCSSQCHRWPTECPANEGHGILWPIKRAQITGVD